MIFSFAIISHWFIEGTLNIKIFVYVHLLYVYQNNWTQTAKLRKTQRLNESSKFTEDEKFNWKSWQKKKVLVTTGLRARKVGRSFLTEADDSQISRCPGRGRNLQGAAVSLETTDEQTNTEWRTRTNQWWGTDVADDLIDRWTREEEAERRPVSHALSALSWFNNQFALQILIYILLFSLHAGFNQKGQREKKVWQIVCNSVIHNISIVTVLTI